METIRVFLDGNVQEHHYWKVAKATGVSFYSTEIRSDNEEAWCPVPGGVQGQVGWGPGQPALVVDLADSNPTCSTGAGTWWSVRSLPTQGILGFCDWTLSMYLVL